MCQKSLWFRFAALNAAVLLAVVALYGAVDRITHRKGFTISRSQIGTSDPANYLEWSSQVFAGKSPYRDGTLPYPPLAIVPMLVPRLFFSTRLGYTLGYGLLMIGINSALLALIERASIEYHCNPTIALAWYTALVAPIASMVLARLDVIVALVCLWGALELGRGRQGTAGFAVGLGTMFKLVPALVLLPYFLRCLSSLLKKGTDQPVPNPKPLIRLRTLGVDRAVCGLFIGAGPWFHGGGGFYGHVDNRYDPRNGYAGPTPNRGDRAFNHFQANEARDGQGHTGKAAHDGGGEHQAGSQGSRGGRWARRRTQSLVFNFDKRTGACSSTGSRYPKDCGFSNRAGCVQMTASTSPE
jgi:hypothetical protein